MGAHVRSFDDCDERIELPGLVSELLSVGALGVARNIHQPGWRWSADVRPAVGTTWCEVRHVGYAVRGRLEVTLADGTTFDVDGGTVFDIPAAHDGRVVGGEPFESIEWLGARTWLADLASLAERVLATIVMTDIVASTTTAVEIGERAWGDRLASYEHAMREIIENYRGRVVKFTGDGVLAIFDGAARSLRAAVAMRAAADEFALRTRASVHTGEIEVSDDDVHGIAVHEAARMLEFAAGGEVVVSATTRMFDDGQRMKLRSLGFHELRGLPGPRELHLLEG